MQNKRILGLYQIVCTFATAKLAEGGNPVKSRPDDMSVSDSLKWFHEEVGEFEELLPAIASQNPDDVQALIKEIGDVMNVFAFTIDRAFLNSGIDILDLYSDLQVTKN